MFFFFIAAIFSSLITFLLISVHSQVRKSNRFLLLSIKSSRLYLSSVAQLVICIGIIAVFLGLIYYVLVLQVVKPTNGLYSPYDVLTGSMINKILLGVLFGILAVIWLTRIYVKEGNKQPRRVVGGTGTKSPQQKIVRKTETNSHGQITERKTEIFGDDNGQVTKSDAKLTFVEIFEGGVLFFIFVMGTTPYSIQEFLSGLTVSTPVAEFKLQNQVGVGRERKENFIDIGKLPAVGGSRVGIRKGVRGFSPVYLSAIGAMATRDFEYAQFYILCDQNSDVTDAKCFNNAIVGAYKTCASRGDIPEAQCKKLDTLKGIEDNLELFKEFTDCLSATYYVDGGRSFFSQNIRVLIPFVAQVYKMRGDVKNAQNAYEALRGAAYKLSIDIESFMKPHKSSVGCSDGTLTHTPNPLSYRPEIPPRSFLEFKFNQDILDRPYFSILYAIFLTLDQQYPEAIGVLDKWLSEYQIGGGGKLDNVVAISNDREVHTLKFWMRFRALSIQAAIYDAWARDQAVDTYTDIVLAENVRQMELYLDQFEKIGSIKRRLNYAPMVQESSFVPKKALLGITFEQTFKDDMCAFTKDSDGGISFPPGQLLLFVSYRATSMIYADRGIRHPDYEHALSLRVDKILNELINSKPSCWEHAYNKYYQADGYPEARAESLRLYGMSQIQKARFKRQVGQGHQSWLRERLEIASAAFKQANSIIYSKSQIEKSERIKKIGPNKFQAGHAEWLLYNLESNINLIEDILAHR